jgi:predicted SAM-dependent methyltransferase
MPEITKVHVGCGPHALLDGWWNTDLREFPGIDQAMDATAPWPWRDQLTHVYAEHFLEHLTIEQSFAFLTEAGNALAPGGRLRMSTPNLTWVMSSHYPTGPDVEVETRLKDTLVINRAFHGWGHKFLWSEELLTGALVSMGFDDVEAYTYGESRDPVLHGIERHGGFTVGNGHPSVIIVEAVRGDRPIAPDQGITTWIDQEFVRHVKAGH